MIPIQEAINNGAWFHCTYQAYSGLCQFRIKVLSFRKLNLFEVDEYEKIELLDIESTVWLMNLEVINLTKKSLQEDEWLVKLVIIDQDGFEFEIFADNHLREDSEFAKKTKMYRFCRSQDLTPKIKAIGAIPFILPNEDDAVYFISIQGGSICEA